MSIQALKALPWFPIVSELSWFRKRNKRILGNNLRIPKIISKFLGLFKKSYRNILKSKKGEIAKREFKLIRIFILDTD